VGAPSRQSCAGRRLAKAQDGSSKVGADATAGRGVARRAASTGTNDGWAGNSLGLRRGELFALRWRDIDEHARVLTVREAVYDGTFATPKTEAGLRQIPLSDPALRYINEWKQRAGATEPDKLVFATRTGTAISPNNVLRRAIFPACDVLELPRATSLTFRRSYSSWSHDKGVPGKVVAQLMGHANVDTTLNVYTQVLDGSLRAAVDNVGGELFTIVH
jgi:integrase